MHQLVKSVSISPALCFSCKRKKSEVRSPHTQPPRAHYKKDYKKDHDKRTRPGIYIYANMTCGVAGCSKKRQRWALDGLQQAPRARKATQRPPSVGAFVAMALTRSRCQGRLPRAGWHGAWKSLWVALIRLAFIFGAIL